nr:MAG TPA: hypothetical protein [Bacteriophage sp.]
MTVTRLLPKHNSAKELINLYYHSFCGKSRFFWKGMV